jgi:hypothetical protein
MYSRGSKKEKKNVSMLFNFYKGMGTLLTLILTAVG